MKRPVNLFLIMLAICLLLNCGKKGINCIVLLDYSASLPDEEFDKYVGMFRQGLLKQMSYHDRMVLIPINEASETKNEIIGMSFPGIETTIVSEYSAFEGLE